MLISMKQKLRARQRRAAAENRAEIRYLEAQAAMQQAEINRITSQLNGAMPMLREAEPSLN